MATEADDKDGKMVRVLHLKGRKEIAKGWLVPTLLLDATMNIDLVCPYWPQVEMAAELFATAPHQHVRQVVDRAFSKSMLDPLDDVGAEAAPMEAKWRWRNLRTVHAIVMSEARRYAPHRVLIVAQKAVKEALAGPVPMPPNVELAHHNAVAGRDEWGPQPARAGVRALFVVGRTMPTLGAVHRLAEALTGSAVEKVEGGWYGRGDAARERLDGRVDAIEADRHPDPLAEAIRWQICEGELVQIIGRGRGVNRTAANPLDVLVMTDAAVPVPIEETLTFADLDPGPDDLMMAAGGMVFENARHAASAYPHLWPSHAAIRQAFVRRSVTPLYKKTLSLQESHTPRRVAYQVAGTGQMPAEALCDLSACPNPEAFLVERLGPLAWCRIEADGQALPAGVVEPSPLAPVEPIEQPDDAAMAPWLGVPRLDDEGTWIGLTLDEVTAMASEQRLSRGRDLP